MTGGSLVGRATANDANGRMLTGTTDAGVVIHRRYSARGFVTSTAVGAQTTTYVQNDLGLTTQVRMPDGQTLQYLYDAGYRLTDVLLNGASITPAMLASAAYPDTPLKALVARGKQSLARALERLVPPAYAQSIGQLPRRVIPIPGTPMPGQPEYDPRRDLLQMAPMSDADRALRRLTEAVARWCECKPEGGYDSPKFTRVTYAHLLLGGHLSPTGTNQSYFSPTERVGQALVDEIIASPDQEVSNSDPHRVVVEATLTRPDQPMGFARGPNGTFVATNRVRLVYERSHCVTRFHARNEVVSMYPIR